MDHRGFSDSGFTDQQNTRGRLSNQSFGEVFTRAEERGELTPGTGDSVAAETTSALMVQRWLLTGRPVDEAFADEVLDTVVLPLLRGAGSRA